MPSRFRARYGPGLRTIGLRRRADFEDDERDLGLKVRCPVLAIWGEHGKMHTPLRTFWRAGARRPRTCARPRIGMRPFHPRGGARRSCWPTCGDFSSRREGSHGCSKRALCVLSHKFAAENRPVDRHAVLRSSRRGARHCRGLRALPGGQLDGFPVGSESACSSHAQSLARHRNLPTNLRLRTPAMSAINGWGGFALICKNRYRKPWGSDLLEAVDVSWRWERLAAGIRVHLNRRYG